MEIRSRESCCRIHYRPPSPGRKGQGEEPGGTVCDSVERQGHVLKSRAHFNGVGDSERKCAISPRSSHHFSPELNIMNALLEKSYEEFFFFFLPVSYGKHSLSLLLCMLRQFSWKGATLEFATFMFDKEAVYSLVTYFLAEMQMLLSSYWKRGFDIWCAFLGIYVRNGRREIFWLQNINIKLPLGVYFPGNQSGSVKKYVPSGFRHDSSPLSNLSIYFRMLYDFS